MPTLKEIAERHERSHPGPYRWGGWAEHPSLWLIGSDRYIVMDFARWGMRGAAPQFLGEDHLLRHAKELVTFEVGNDDVVGVDAAKAPGSGVYRGTISGIAHPDAEALRASWEDREYLLRMVRRMAEVIAEDHYHAYRADSRNTQAVLDYIESGL